MQNAVEALLGLQLLFDDRHQDINTDRDPDLRLHRVVTGAVKVLDAEVLLYPLKEQFHFPTALVEHGNSNGRKLKVIRQKDKTLPRLGVDVMNPP